MATSISIYDENCSALGVEAKVIHLGKGCFQGVGGVEASSPDLSAMIGLLLFALSEVNALSFA